MLSNNMSKITKRFMRKPYEPVKVKILLGYIFLIAFASFIVWTIYSEILKLSADKTDLNKLDEKVMYINGILTDLYQAEGLERTYAQTGDRKDGSSYEHMMDTISMQMDTLTLLLSNPVQQQHIDSIRKLFDIKSKNLKELAAIRKAGSSDDLFQQAMVRLTYNMDSINYFFNVYKTVITNRDSTFVKQKKKNFLGRIVNVFSSHENRDSALKISISQSVRLDSILNAFNPADSVAQFLTSVMEDIRKESNEVERQMIIKEQEILDNNRTITLQLRQMLSVFENDEFIRSLEELKTLQGGIRHTTWMVVGLSTVALLTIVVFLVLILKDISRSRHYRLRLEKEKEYSDTLLKSKEQFMLSIAHDLKSPLGSITGYASLMHAEENVNEKKHYLQNINKASEQILRLISDLTDLTRIETGKLTIDHIPFNLKSLTEEILSGFYPVALSKNLDFNLEYTISSTQDYLGDPVRIKQVLENLVSNALKFTDRGKVVVRVYNIESFGSTDRICFEISDTGIGISEKDKKQIFNEFTRVASKDNRKYEGTGLGLTIAQRIVTLLKGTITLNSMPGKGSLFAVKLPLEKCTSSSPGNKKSGAESTTKPERSHVLLIDDDEVFLNMTAKILLKEGMKVTRCSHPLKALKILENHMFDLIMTDIHMPAMTGTDLLVHIQKKIDAHIPVVAVTGQEELDYENYMKAGFTACIQKPFIPDELINDVGLIIAGRQWQPNTVRRNDRRETGTLNERLYNLSQIKKFAGDDTESVNRILESFVLTSRENVVLFQKNLDEKKYKSLSELAHKMLPMLRQLESFRVAALLSKIERTKADELTHEQWNNIGNETLSRIKQLIDLICEEQSLTIRT